jgi:hypothetical protein
LSAAGVKELAKKPVFRKNMRKHTSVAKATIYFTGFIPGLKSRPTARMSFPQPVKAALILRHLRHPPAALRAGF